MSTPSPLRAPRARPARSAPPRVGALVRGLIADASAKHGPGVGDLAAAWAEIVGARLARMTRPEKFTGTGRTRTLHVGAPGSAAVLVQANAQTIRERVNAYCGAGAAARVKVARLPAGAFAARDAAELAPPGLTPQDEAHVRAMTAPIADDGVRDALNRLGRAVLRQAKAHQAGEAQQTDGVGLRERARRGRQE